MQQSSGEERRYSAENQKSGELSRRAGGYMPGGNTRTVLHYEPHPAYIARGEGFRVYDVDGNERIDFINNQTSMILGHAHPAVVEAVTEQVARGTAFAGPTESEIELAGMLCQRVPGVESIRFANSGTEAAMNAVRAAMAFTGKELVAKFEGAYHGTSDILSISVGPPVDEAGEPTQPRGYLQTQLTRGGAGIPRSVLNHAVVLPFNDFAASSRILRERAGELAAVIVDPVMASSGYPPVRDEFLRSLRRLTEQLDIPLVFDEVISLRVAPGGAQELFDVVPDITAMGKLIGGGFPVGAFGGRQEIMEVFDPSGGSPRVAQSGTFSANPVTMVAGAATLAQLTPDVYERMAGLGDMLRAKVQTMFAELEFPAQITGLASLFKIHFTTEEIVNYRGSASSDKHLEHEVFLGLLNEGIQLGPSCEGNVSAPMGEQEIDALVEALRRVIQQLR